MTGAWHCRAADRADQAGGRTAIRIWCECGRVIIGAARTVRVARRRARRGHRHHAGFAAAGGPVPEGWDG